MNSGTGIQELMAAETRASQIVAEARIGMFLQRALLPSFPGLDIKINVHILCSPHWRQLCALLALFYTSTDRIVFIYNNYQLIQLVVTV